MRREASVQRANWKERCEGAGFDFHSMDGVYWDESACYAFSADEVDRLEAVTGELHRLCLAAVEVVVREKRMGGDVSVPDRKGTLILRSGRLAASRRRNSVCGHPSRRAQEARSLDEVVPPRH